MTAVLATLTAMIWAAAPTGIGAAATTTTTSASTTTTGSSAFYPTGMSALGVTAQAGYDQVVFQFEQKVPDYTVKVVGKPILASPSDKEVAVAGNAFVEITMNPSSTFDLGGNPIYKGPAQITFNGKAVVQVVQTQDFEGYLTWVVGLTEQVPYVVMTASDPARLAIDFQDPSAVHTNPSFTG
ncbi:MAG TPA: hypothetical protein VMT43_07625 [Acidimicrobiales bacterium]|nr:hypothetical protein [Acidimicrobiales bacterium]